MELTDAERECRNDAADYERERWKVHTIQHCGITIEYAQYEEEIGPYVDIWRNQPYVHEITSRNMRDLDVLIDALTTAREHVFGEREES